MPIRWHADDAGLPIQAIELTARQTGFNPRLVEKDYFCSVVLEYQRRVTRKRAALRDIRGIVEKKLLEMLGRNPLRMDYYGKWQEIIADYNREKDRSTVEQMFAQLVELARSLDAE